MFSKILIIVFCVISLFSISTVAQLYYNNYVYPCEKGDYQCITTVLADRSSCDTQTYGSAPQVYGMNNVEFQIPAFNTTFRDQYSNVYNVDKCKVATFYFNLTADEALLAIECPNLLVEANRLIIQHFPNAENKYYNVYYKAQFPKIIFTATFDHSTDIDLCNSFVYSYATGKPKYTITPNNKESGDFLRRDGNKALSHISVLIREELLTQGPPIFRLFVDDVLCDFGCLV